MTRSRRPHCFIRNTAIAAIATLLCSGCSRQTPPAPELDADERALADTYVRLAVLEALHAQSPDSVEAVLNHLGATLDTTAVHRALGSLAAEPLRWQMVYEAISRRLADLEAKPQLWWKAVSDSAASASSGPVPATGR